MDAPKTATANWLQIENSDSVSGWDNYGIGSAAAGSHVTANFDNVYVENIAFDVKENIKNVQIIVQQFVGRPSGISIGPADNPYGYLSIIVINLDENKVENIVLTFKVEKSWISANSIDESKMTLNQWDNTDNTWTSYSATKVGEDDNYSYFSVNLPHLSTFVIGGSGITTTTYVAPPAPAPDFTISVSPTSGSVVQGGSTSVTVSIGSVGGFSGTVSLSASSLPSDATASFSPDNGTLSFNSTLTISTASTTPAGTYSITITGTGGGKTHTTTCTLTVTAAVVPDFTISVSPTSSSVVQGGSAGATVSITSIGGFANTVSLSVSGLPSGATASFSPSSGTPSFTSTLTISTASTTPAGTYTITITGTGGGKTYTTTFSLTVTVAPPAPAVPLEVGILGVGIIFIAAIVIFGLLKLPPFRKKIVNT
jgi:PGF-pre-PGF domain-containing protein